MSNAENTTKTAFISIVGRPNVGKSTMMNSIIGEKIAIVSKKPQTTRNRIMGVYTRGLTQYVFVDTPGMHKPRTKLGDFMVGETGSAIRDADIIVLVVEPVPSVGDIEAGLINKVKASKTPSVLVINKTDTATAEDIAKTIAAYSAVYTFDAVVPMCAKNGKGCDILLSEIDRHTIESDWLFPADMITDQPEKQIAAEIVREKLLRTLDKEIPHGVAVVIEGFEEKRDIIRIRAEIYCEKASHKGIIVGKGGAALKLVGSRAREDMEKFFDTKVFLDLWVKVKENWRDMPSSISNFGYKNE